MRWPVRVLLPILIGGFPIVTSAQSRDIVFPAGSPRGGASADVGFTRVSVDYGRPAVRGRTVWGELVPWDSVWRAGANENTVLAFSSPVIVGGTTIPAGRYGLHMIPTKGPWTIILSREANNWGSFSYRQDEDAVRFRASPRPSEMTERLQYTMDDVTDSSMVLTLRWEKLAVPIPLAINTRQVVADSIQSQLRALPQFFPQAWSQAARWALVNDRVDQAGEWADKAIALQPNYQSLRVKSMVLARQGNTAAADSLQARALAVATEADVNAWGYELLGQKKVDQAIGVFARNVKDYPRSWNTYDSLAEAYANKGDRKLARANYEKALAMVGDEVQKQRIRGALTSLQ
jgi:hypothetical protein